MRRPLALLLAIAALGNGCGDDQPLRSTGNALDDIEVEGKPGEEPTLTFDKPFSVTETITRILEEGDGEPIAATSVVTFHYVFVNGRDGKVLDSSYEREPVELVFEDSLMAGIRQGLDGVPAGSRVLVGVAPEDGLGADPEQGVLDNDTLVFYAEILDVRIPLERAQGEAVAPVDGLPTVELADDGAPTITVPEGEPPTELVAQPLIEGDGAVVETGHTITVHYAGVLYADSSEFDSSWERGESATFQIGVGGVIVGWDEGLVGRTVGSQVLLVVPPDKGYGDTGQGDTIPPDATLVFVVDILDTR